MVKHLIIVGGTTPSEAGQTSFTPQSYNLSRKHANKIALFCQFFHKRLFCTVQQQMQFSLQS